MDQNILWILKSEMVSLIKARNVLNLFTFDILVERVRKLFENFFKKKRKLIDEAVYIFRKFA